MIRDQALRFSLRLKKVSSVGHPMLVDDGHDHHDGSGDSSRSSYQQVKDNRCDFALETGAALQARVL
jgi:hypothetical protein